MDISAMIDMQKYLEHKTGIKDVPLGRFNPMYQLTEFEFFAILDMVRGARVHLRDKSYGAAERRLDIINDMLQQKKEGNPEKPVFPGPHAPA